MTINLNGIEFYTAQEVEERIREAVAGKEEKVDMTNLPIGTLVKVVDNRVGHWHKVGEILPITELKGRAYRLAGRCAGLVSVKDIEFVSFPEEGESTSGDEEDPDLGFKNGDYAKVLKRNMVFDEGDVVKILDVEGDGHPLAEREDGVDGYAIASSLMKIDKPSGNGDEEEFDAKHSEEGSELEFKVGDKVRVKGADYHSLESGDIGTVTGIAESIRHTHNGRLIPTPYEVTINNLGQFVAPEHLELIEEVESEDSEIKAGDIVIATGEVFGITEGEEYEVKEFETGMRYFLDDDGDVRHVNVHEGILRKKSDKKDFKEGDIVIATEGELDITEGNEYEIREDLHGVLYFLDDVGDVRHVRVHEDRLRKKTAKRGFKKGDIVYIKEEITDNFGDSIRPGVLTEFIEAGIGRGMRNPDGLPVLVKDGDLDKLTLVCRAEDRQDD